MDDRVRDRLDPAVVSVHESQATPVARTAGTARRSPWTAGRILALVLGALLTLMSLAQLAAGLTALWADRAQRDAAGYVTTDVHLFSTEGSALVTEPIELGSPGVEWLYSPLLLDEVRIRATSVEAESALFVGIGPSTDVYGYLAGVGHTLISEFWGDRVQIVDGDTLGSAPEAQDFWVASAIGSGAQTVTWEPANGSWAVVVMNADGRPGVDVATDLGAVMPSLPWITIGLLAVGTVFLVGGTLLIAGMIRRQARAKVQ